MAGPSEADIRKTLASVPGVDRLLEGIAARDGHVQVSLAVDPAAAKQAEPVRQAAEAAIRAMPGILSATAVLTAAREPAPKPQAAPQQQSPMNPQPIPGVTAIVAVASGKGGVGKSTVAANLATALAEQGQRVGLMDADVFGPSVPRMLGANQKPDSDGKMLKPVPAHGLSLMSMGFMVDEQTAMVWRGPMVMSAVQQMLFQVDWGRLDVLVLDLPPGTGDAQLTLAQKLKIDGAVIVSTPQDIALLDARRGISMFQKVGIPILGVVENMSMYVCPNCGHEAHIFGHGGAAAEARSLGVDLLAEIPLSLPIREQADAGTPIVLAQPTSPEAEAFRALAGRVTQKL